MPFVDLKREILDQDMCTRCGACVAVCPPGWLAVGDRQHCRYPRSNADAMALRRVLAVLGGLSGQGHGNPTVGGRHLRPEPHAVGALDGDLPPEPDLDVHQSTRALRGAAAGGAGTTLMLTALRSGLADAVIVVGRDAERPWVPAALITDSEDEVIRCGQTSYCLTPNLQLLRDPRFSAHRGGGRAVRDPGCPQDADPACRLPAVAAKVVLAVEIACASSTKLAGTEYLITEKLGIELQDVAEMRYRDGEYPGEFAVKTRDGERQALPFFEVVDEFKRLQDAPLSGLRRLVVRSRRRLHFRRRSQYLCEQPERGAAAQAIHRDDANARRAKRSCRARFSSAWPA